MCCRGQHNEPTGTFERLVITCRAAHRKVPIRHITSLVAAGSTMNQLALLNDS